MERRFLTETNHIVRVVKATILSSITRVTEGTQDDFSPLEYFQVFMPPSVMVPVVSVCNSALRSHKKIIRPVWISYIALLSALYGMSVRSICDAQYQEFFFQLGISSERYRYIFLYIR